MFLLLREPMSNWSQSVHACLLERATFFWTFRGNRRILSSSSPWTSYRTQTSSMLSPHQRMSQLFIFSSSGILSEKIPRVEFIASNWTSSALGITPRDPAYPFVAPPNNDLVIDFVNELGYLEELQFVSKMAVNSLYQPWRTILTLINQCLMGKTSDSDRPRHPVLQIL
ncbi:hypothetical protein Tco_1384817 [Tanacetum coccineum]